MKIALINLPNPALAEPWSNFPLGLGYVAAAIERKDYDVQVLDWCEGFPAPLTAADIYGMQVTAPQVRLALLAAEVIKKKYPGSLIVAGGPQASVDSYRMLADPHVDAIVAGEGEFAFYELVRQYETTGAIESTYQQPEIKLLDDVPFPARHLFPNFKENALRTHNLLKGDYTDGGQTTITASRGCPYACSFCAPHPRKLRYRSPENVTSEIRSIVSRYGIHQFKWQDDTFTLNKRWVLELCENITRLPFRTFHRAHTRVNVFDEEMAAAMYLAGFRVLCFGIESFSQRLLDLNAKSTTIDQIETAFKIAKRYGFKTVGFLIFGMPGENRQSVDQTKEGIIRNRKYLDYLNLATMVPLPGTPIHNDPQRFGCRIIDDEDAGKWIVDHDTDDRVMVVTDGVTEDEMRRLKVEMYQFMRDEGYSRPEWKRN
jgi:anaerobic magnesium-protoporphyrin IX monomethyl ester cyclase